MSCLFILNDAEDRGLLGCGGTLEDAAHSLFDGEALDDCLLLCVFMVPLTVCLILVLLGCEGFMTDLSVLGDEMMLYDDMRVGVEIFLISKHFCN